MRPDALAAALDAVAHRGEIAMAVVGTAGTTDFGAIDPLAPIAQRAKQHGAWFHVFFVTMGAALTVTMFLLMRELGVSVGLAFVTTALFVVLPVTVLYENFLLYTYPVALLLLVSGLFLVRYLRTRRPLYGFVFFGALAALVLIRGTFHLAWLLAASRCGMRSFWPGSDVEYLVPRSAQARRSSTE